MADVDEVLAKHREAIEALVEKVCEKNPEYAERLRAQLDTVQPDLDDLQDMLNEADMGGEPHEEAEEASGESAESDEEHDGE